MNVRARFFWSFCGICLVFVFAMYVTVLQLPPVPIVRAAILAEGLAYLVVAIGLFRIYVKRLPPTAQQQKSKTARSARRVAWLFFAAPVFAFLARGQQLSALPYRLGLVLALFPVILGVYFMNLSMKLGRAHAETGTGFPTEQ